MTGSRLGHYRVGERIGSGGMGEVYRAHDERLQRDVAIKVFPPSSVGDRAARNRLLREARAAAALNHPHICTVFEVGEESDQAFIAMELVEGQTLDALIPAGGVPSRAGAAVPERRLRTPSRMPTSAASCTVT